MTCPSCGYCSHCGRRNAYPYSWTYANAPNSYAIGLQGAQLNAGNAQLSAANGLNTMGYIQVQCGGTGNGGGGGGCEH